MKNTLIVLSLIIGTLNSFSQSQFQKSLSEVSDFMAEKLVEKNIKRIVVLYVNENKEETILGTHIADIISINLINNQAQFYVVDKENWSGMDEVKQLMADGYIDIDKTIEIGKILSVDAIIIGSYNIFNTIINLKLKALNSKTGYSIAATYKDILIDDEVDALTGTSSGQVNKGNNRPLNSNEVINNSKTVDKECETKNTGVYCILNNTNSSKAFRFFFDEKPIMDMGPLSGTYYEDIGLVAGETKCLYNKAARSYKYEVWGKNSNNATVIVDSGNISVEKCRSKTFIIK